MDDLASHGQANIQHSQHDESVSFQIAIQATLLRYFFFQSSSSLPIEPAPLAEAIPHLSKSQSLATLPVSLDHSNLPLPTSSSDFATTYLPDPATQQDHLRFDDAFEDSDPDPGCLDLDPSGQDSDAGTQLPNLESVFENTCHEDLLIAIKFIWALQSASLDDTHCKMDQNTIQLLRNPPTAPFDIGSLPNLCLGLDLFLANMNSSIESFNAN